MSTLYKKGDRIRLTGQSWFRRGEVFTVTKDQTHPGLLFFDHPEEPQNEWWIFDGWEVERVLPEPLADWEYELLYGGNLAEEPIFAALVAKYDFPSLPYDAYIPPPKPEPVGPQKGEHWYIVGPQGSRYEEGVYATVMSWKGKLAFRFPSAYYSGENDVWDYIKIDALNHGWVGKRV